jgi:hypothetical protein
LQEQLEVRLAIAAKQVPERTFEAVGCFFAKPKAGERANDEANSATNCSAESKK